MKVDKRVVLPARQRELAENILEQVGINTHSQLFAILLVNYGEKLVSALKCGDCKNIN